MYFSRITPDMEKSSPERLARVGMDDYRIHQELWRLFEADENAQRDFLYRRQGPSPVFLVLSKRKPVNKGIWTIETKPFHPIIGNGDRFSFDLRANPVRKARNAIGKQERHDVVMDLKHHYKTLGKPLPPQAVLEQEAGADWLLARAEKLGFRVHPEALWAEGYRQHRYFKKKICFSTLDFKGVLEVTDEERFRQALQEGIGSSKAFGCGLLLLRRV